MNESTKIKDTTVSTKPQSVYVEILFLLSNKLSFCYTKISNDVI